MYRDGRVFQRGEFWHIAYYVNGKEQRESSRSAMREDAEALLERRLATRRARMPRRPKARQRRPQVSDDIAQRTILADLIRQNAQPYTGRVGIYFLLRKREIVYVGQSVDVDARLAQHRRDGTRFDAYSYLPCHEEELRYWEQWFISALHPKSNWIGVSTPSPLSFLLEAKADKTLPAPGCNSTYSRRCLVLDRQLPHSSNGTARNTVPPSGPFRGGRGAANARVSLPDTDTKTGTEAP